VIVDFYHLSQSPLERVLPAICEKVLASGERLLVVARPELIEGLDALLWTYAPDSFLPHGCADAPRSDAQPILLSSEFGAANGATQIALADGEWREAALAFDRTFYFFDAGNLEAARLAWRALKERPGLQRRYWKQADGRWVLAP
jgi:DNA polymerase III subunit chi